MVVYIIGSLRNPMIPKIANQIQEVGHEAFADWYGAGPEADDKWKEYEIERGRNYLQALTSHGAQAVFNFDKKHLERADAAVLVAPAGKSGHLELGWALGKGKKGYYLLDNPDRWDVMLQFATLVTDKLDDIIKDLNKQPVKASDCLNKRLDEGKFVACYCKNCKDLNAGSIEQASLQKENATAWEYLRGASEQVGKPLNTEQRREPSGSATEVSSVVEQPAKRIHRGH
jgi:hypothetical protein